MQLPAENLRGGEELALAGTGTEEKGKKEDRYAVPPLIKDKYVEEEAAFGKWREMKIGDDFVFQHI